MRLDDLTPEERKRRRNKQHQASIARYQAKAYGRYTIRARYDGADGITPEQIEQAAAAAGLSVNAWIVQACAEKLQRQA